MEWRFFNQDVVVAEGQDPGFGRELFVGQYLAGDKDLSHDRERLVCCTRLG